MASASELQLQKYFLTNFTSCPPTPFLESYWFFKMTMNVLTGPVTFLGVYGIVVILVATPKEIRNAKWVVMGFQVTSLWLGALACFLERPYIHYPSSARYDTGLFLLMGMSFRLASILGQTAYSIQGISRVMLFESRYNQICSNPRRKMSLELRVIFYIIHYSVFMAFYLIHLLPQVDNVAARLEILKSIPCPEPTFFYKETEVMTLDMTRQFQLSALQSIYLFSLAYFFAFLCGYCLWRTSSGISEKTRKLQEAFLVALVIQSVLPFIVLFVPSLFYWTLSAVGDEYSVLGSFKIICIAIHSILASVLLVILHSAYRQYTAHFFKRKKPAKKFSTSARKMSVVAPCSLD